YNGARVQATAVVKDQFDNTLNAAVTWSVLPTSLGQIGPTGLFVAADGASGVATLTATSGGASATVALTVAQRPIVDVSGLLSAPRHELTHMMESQTAGGAFIPAWFNEGSARLEELTLPETRYLAMVSAYGAASMAATGTLFSLADLRSQAAWNARDGLAGQF